MTAEEPRIAAKAAGTPEMVGTAAQLEAAATAATQLEATTVTTEQQNLGSRRSRRSTVGVSRGGAS